MLPLTILSTLPSAGVGALLILLVFGYQLTVIALIGIILLIGIVKKNGIMMVDFAITAERRDGLAPVAAIRQACLLRFRPILMTTMAALLSGVPLMLENGAGSELRKPLGFAMVGGLALSQVLTLYTTPVIYLYLDQLQHWLAPRRDTACAEVRSDHGEFTGRGGGLRKPGGTFEMALHSATLPCFRSNWRIFRWLRLDAVAVPSRCRFQDHLSWS